MTKKNVYRIIISIILLQLFCWAGVLSAEELDGHSAYKITSYNLGSLQGLQVGNSLATDQEHKPLFITSAATDILKGESEGLSFLGEITPLKSNISSIALSAQYDATSKISLQGAVGLTRNTWTADLFDNVNGTSWEANLGVIYKLLNNLSYELHFGYMDTGDLFTNRSSYSDVESIIMISNQLTLSF